MTPEQAGAIMTRVRNLEIARLVALSQETVAKAIARLAEHRLVEPFPDEQGRFRASAEPEPGA